MKTLDAAASHSALLPELLALETERDLWKPEELQAILAHQLAAPLEFDLCMLGPETAHILMGQAAPAEAPLRTFRDLFQHPHPALELLEATRQFAKTCRTNPEGSIPDEIATLLYALSISVALVKCGRRITKLNDTGLRHCLGWAIAQTWVDADTRALLYEGYRCLGSRESPDDA